MTEKQGDSSSGGGAMRVDVDLVRQLAGVLDETQLTEIEVQDGERKVRVARPAENPKRRGKKLSQRPKT